MERYLGRHDADRPDGDLALFEKRCDEFEEKNPVLLMYYKARCAGGVIKVSCNSRVPSTFSHHPFLNVMPI